MPSRQISWSGSRRPTIDAHVRTDPAYRSDPEYYAGNDRGSNVAEVELQPRLRMSSGEVTLECTWSVWDSGWPDESDLEIFFEHHLPWP